MVVEDETRHAQLAWRTIAWCRAQAPMPGLTARIEAALAAHDEETRAYIKAFV